MSVRGFVEYKIGKEDLYDYLRVTVEIRDVSEKAGLRHYEISESIARPGQFLETFLVDSIDEYQRIENNLLHSEESGHFFAWRDSYVVGGVEVMKKWFFEIRE